MPLFEYTARAPSGQIQKGQLEVGSNELNRGYLATKKEKLGHLLRGI